MKALTPRRVPLDLSIPCKPWENNRSPEGYGRIMIDGVVRYVHRLAYQLHVGPIPRGFQVGHACHDAAFDRGECPGGACEHRGCWEPAHLETMTNQENTARGGHPTHVAHRRATCVKRGHDLTVEANVYTNPKTGSRRCRLCPVIDQRERRNS